MAINARHPEAMVAAVARMLRPLVRLLMQSGVTLPALVERLREVYVDVAVKDLLTGRGEATDSRISLMTGIHRKEVRRLRTQPGGASPANPVGVASVVIARWAGSPAYVDADGTPLTLLRTTPDPAAPSFDNLVAAVTTDVRPRAVLEDLLSHGLVVLETEGRVRLQTVAFVPKPGREDQLFYFARNVGDHLAAAAANIRAVESPPFLDRSVHYDRLRPDTAAKLEAAGRETAMEMLLAFNRLALELSDQDDQIGGTSEESRRHRINLGVYLYADRDDAESA